MSEKETFQKLRKKKAFRWRAWLRALHRDAGYFVVGLTLIYALSGLAVNHIADWDPNFTQVDREIQLQAKLPEDDASAATRVARELGFEEKPSEFYREEGRLEIIFEHHTLSVDTENGHVHQRGQEPRLLLRAANWLHLNRGKKAWTFIADGYAILLLFLAISGLFMIAGKKGIRGRGAVVATLGAMIPILYVALSGGP